MTVEYVTLGGTPYEVTSEQVLAATKRQRPDRGGVKPGVHYVVLRGRKVPAKWAVRLALGVPGEQFTTGQAVAILRRLGFTCGQQPRDD